MPRRRSILAFLLTLPLLGCEGDPVAPPCARPEDFAVSPTGLIDLLPGQTFRVVASHGAPCGAELGPVVWRSSNPQVARVQPGGAGEATVVGIAPGNAAIEVLSPERPEAWAGVSVRVFAMPADG